MIDETIFNVADFLLGAVLIAGGAAAIGYFVRGWRLGRASMNWPRTRGIVIDHHIEKREGEGRATYYPHIKYRFKVAGQVYVVNEWTHRAIHNATEEKAKAIVDKYPKEGEVTVYYDPLNPRRAVLEPGITVVAYVVGFFVGIVLMIFGGLLVAGII